MKRVNHLRLRHEALTLVTESRPIATYTLPAKVRPKGNGSQGLTAGGRFARAEDAAKQRRLGSLMGSQLVRAFAEVPGPEFYVVRLTRFGPQAGDDDNITAAMKPWRDGIASRLGVDDGDDFVRYVVDQEKGPYAVRAELYVKASET